MGVPTFYTRLLASPALTREAAAGMRLFVSGSAPLLASTHQEFEARTGQRILERYGMTETGMNASNPLEGERRAGTVGKALPGDRAPGVRSGRAGAGQVPPGAHALGEPFVARHLLPQCAGLHHVGGARWPRRCGDRAGPPRPRGDRLGEQRADGQVRSRADVGRRFPRAVHRAAHLGRRLSEAIEQAIDALPGDRESSARRPSSMR